LSLPPSTGEVVQVVPPSSLPEKLLDHVVVLRDGEQALGVGRVDGQVRLGRVHPGRHSKHRRRHARMTAFGALGGGRGAACRHRRDRYQRRRQAQRAPGPGSR
jgi:hypothetical protein